MKSLSKNHNFALSLNILGLLSVTIPLYFAFYYQFLHHEVPCPLCLLQRVGLTVAALGFLFNMYRKICYTNYILVIISALFTSFVALRQSFLHILPGDPGYGSSFLGLHFYNWTFIACIGLIMAVAIMISLTELTSRKRNLLSLAFLKKPVTLLFTFALIGNVISTFLECGFKECPSDPIGYTLFSK